MRYLGILWYSFLTFTEHFKTIRKKVDILTCQLNSVAHRFYSKRLNLFRRIYVAAIEPYILFGHGAWGHRLNLLQIRQSLNSIQRRPLLKITGAFRTAPSESLPVIAGLLPLDLKAIEVHSIFLVNSCREETKIGATNFLPIEYEEKVNITNIHPTNRISIPFTIQEPKTEPLAIFTDGSGIDDKIGVAFVAYYHGVEIHTHMARLPDYYSVFQAEVLGIKMALDFCATIQHIKDIHIYSYSRAALQSLADPINHNSIVQKTKKAFLKSREKLNIKIHWIKAHIGHQGNERADQLAKEATQRPSPDLTIPKPTSSLKRDIRTGLIEQWNDRWFMSTNGRQTYKYIPLVGLKRITEIPQVVHFLTNHGRFQHYFFRYGQLVCLTAFDGLLVVLGPFFF
ncbi:hypothetical protein AVEN_160898-1 [Araneus ventricosus]|uniref:ribonuclease H n=1 Tax=Araneus ventricosus TaxID=182803 RepID=A0A4Y2D8T3_ARAVE|nr:hypothetical protein AVEN_160898-1 [Araneus ventricosus]